MSEEIIEISHETIGQNLLLYPSLRKLRVAEIINHHCKGEAEIDVGVVAETIILSRFSQERVPMYKLQQFCKDKGMGTLYSLDTTKINDDRAGRALDAIHENLSNIKAALIVGVIKEYDITIDEIHTDITNILFSGSYENTNDRSGLMEKIESGQLQVTYGHTKKGQDSRKKQVNFSLSVTAEGVPIWYEALLNAVVQPLFPTGNTTDSVVYVPHLESLSGALGITSPLIVGDSKLVSNNNMVAFCRAGVFFIGPASVDKNEKKRLLKLWENGATFQPLQFKQIESPIPFFGMETERKPTDKEKKEDYTIRP